MSNTLQDAESAAHAEDPNRQSVRGMQHSLLEPAASTIATPKGSAFAPHSLLANPDIRHFAKFCIVGASSTAVMFCVLNLCKFKLHLPLFTSLTVAFLLSCCNGFIWNRMWTFKAARGNSSHEQSIKFFAVNLVGYLLNTSIVVLIVALFTAHGGLLGNWSGLGGVFYNMLTGEKRSYPALLVNGAQATAVCIVVWWNYFANRLWTFKH